MKNLYCLLAVVALVMAGCNAEVEYESSANVQTTKTSALEADICGKCGCCADCKDCCSEDAEKCSCGFNKGSALCCAEGMKPMDGKYCKSCGHVKGTESCCAEGNESCSKCGLAEGAPLCCKVKTGSEHGEHDGHGEHAMGEHENEKEHDGGEHKPGEHDEGSGEHGDHGEHSAGEHDSAAEGSGH